MKMVQLRILVKNMETKKQIRRQIQEDRDKLTEEERKEKSLIIMNKVSEHYLYQNAKQLLIYMDYRNEVQTHFFIEKALKDGKRVFCPCVLESAPEPIMEFYEIKDLSELETGFRGILEPQSIEEKRWNPTNSCTNALMIMPGVAFDTQKNRIGYGKGFYDRYVQKYGKYLKIIAIAFSCQMIENIHTEAHDRKADILFTEMESFL